MIELVTTVMLTAGSGFLLVYWFRYMCLLILSAQTTRDYAGDVASANQLSFLRVQSELRGGASVELDRLHTALDRDYLLLTNLLSQAAHSGDGESLIETRMLGVNYRLMGMWCKTSRHFSLAASRRALDEMSMVVAHFANAMGERAACGAAA